MMLSKALKRACDEFFATNDVAPGRPHLQLTQLPVRPNPARERTGSGQRGFPGFLLRQETWKPLHRNDFGITVELMSTSPITLTNNPVQIAPGLTLDDKLYTLAAAGVAEHLPELTPLTPEVFFSQRWTLVPDEQTNEAYKAELTVFKSDTRTVKINRWFDDDERDGKGPRPHNHPWDFYSVILGGTYVESRWIKRDGVVVPELDVEHRTGAVNKIGRTGSCGYQNLRNGSPAVAA